MNKKKKMSRKKAIRQLSIVTALILIVSFFTFARFPIGDGTYKYVSVLGGIKLGIDLEGGVYCVLEVVPQTNVDAKKFEENIQGTIEILRNRLASKGYTEATVVQQTNRVSGSLTTYKIRIEIPSVAEPEELFSIIGKPAVLTFEDPNGNVILKGEHIQNAYVTKDDTNQYAIGLEFTSKGRDIFAQATSEFQGQQITIKLDKEELMSPTVNQVISDGKAIITGNYTYQQAKDMVMQIQSGALLVTFKESEPKVISATLGENAIRSGLIAGAIGLILIFAFLAVYYRGLGLSANIALIIYTLLLLILMSQIPWVQLTLPGIAGLILGIGMAVDGNVIIFERIKEEYKAGKTLRASIDLGFKRAIIAIVDSNITSLFAAATLWILGTGAIQGFAVVLFLSVVVSMFTSIFVTKFLIERFYAIGDSAKFFGLNRKGEVVDV